MRVLVTGHNGYVGSVLTPMLRAAGHDVVGLDIDLFEPCIFGNGVLEVPTIHRDVRDVEASEMGGFGAVVHLAAVCNDPIGDLNPSGDLRHQPHGVRPSRSRGQARGRDAVPVLVVVQSLRQGRRRLLDEHAASLR
jgi:hypothetical protein